jgi:hypothetical protein
MFMDYVLSWVDGHVARGFALIGELVAQGKAALRENRVQFAS